MEKYSSNGNVYIVVEPNECALNEATVRYLCKINSSDGLLNGPKKISDGCYFLDIYNSDGSKAEISGNGMTIFATYLKNHKYIELNHKEFHINTDFCSVKCELLNSGFIKLILGESKILFDGFFEIDEEYQKKLHLPDVVKFYAVNIKNPHCVVILDNISKEIATTLGPIFENNCKFKNKTNVQFVKLINQNECYAEIWERGSGYTLSSGSSACAISSVLVSLYQNFNANVNVNMPGGSINVNVQNNICSIINKLPEKLHITK